MKQVWGIFFVFALVAGLSLSGYAQSTSNKGTDFWVAYSGHIDAKTSRMTLFLSSDVSTTYKVEASGQIISSGNIAANVVTAVFIDPSVYDVHIGSSDIVEANKGIHITSGNSISVYSVVSHSARTGASLILPTKSLGREYYAFSYENKGSTASAYSEFTIVAVEDETEIEITPTATSLNGARTASSTYKITQKLNKGDVYQYQSAADVSGSVIKTLGTCKPIAVFSGSTWTAFCEDGNPTRPGSGDNLYQQLFPVSSWGKNFVTAPFYNTENGNTDVVRIIVSEDNTTINVNASNTMANTVPLSNPYKKGSIITYFTKTPSTISSDKPIGVAQYQTTQNCNTSNGSSNNAPFQGDPEMTILNPIEQTLSDITVFSKINSIAGVTTNIQKYFLNIIIKTADAPSLKVDGSKVSSFKSVNNEYSYAIIDVSSSLDQHRIIADGGFVAIAYGYGQVESYAYLAGADVKNLFQNIIVSTQADKVISDGCTNDPINLTLRLPYHTTSIVWDVDNGQTPYTDNNPAFTTELVEGKTIYVYQYPLADPVYTTAGKRKISVSSLNPNPVGCDPLELLSIDFDIFDPPTAGFTTSSQSCVNSELIFTDTSTGNGKEIKKWTWDFGDGVVSSDQNPVHSYSKAGDFLVKLFVEGETGCASTVFSKSIHVSINPVADFKFTKPDCATKALVFTDASSSAEGAIIKWIWDFGNGQAPEERTSAAPFEYIYPDTGTYSVSLKVLTDKGCESAAMLQTVVVHANPVVNFGLPEVCITDQFALFTDSTTISDHSDQLVYAWNFGDDQATVSNPNTSDQKDPKHKYTRVGNYQVTLTVRSKDGCESTLVKSFTVNGATPKANFTVINPTKLCSNKEVVFINTSTVDFGDIGKLEWYFDYGNSPGIKVVDENPEPGKQYRFQYPIFTSPASKDIVVRLIAYSGGSCLNEYRQTITLTSVPKVSFSQPVNVCMEVPPFHITQAVEINNQAGTGNFYGKGVSLSGIFDPAKAGVGTHTLKYVFTASNGCQDSLSRDITVMPTPTVYAGRDTFMLEGEQMKLNAIATGSNLVYKWMPAAGLSRDDIPDPIASPTNNVTYTLSVTSDQGCVAIDDIFIKVLKIPEVPNTFTPNGDGVNDLWDIRYLSDYESPTIQVFNRYGDLIYNMTGYSVPWDGKVNGTDLPVGTYYYIVRPKMGRKVISGSVTIVR